MILIPPYRDIGSILSVIKSAQISFHKFRKYVPNDDSLILTFHSVFKISYETKEQLFLGKGSFTPVAVESTDRSNRAACDKVRTTSSEAQRYQIEQPNNRNVFVDIKK